MIRFIVALTLSVLTATTAIADDVYRWTDPQSGKVLMSTNLPSYPIKEKRMAGRLPNGDVIELILDTNAPEVKALIEKRRAQKAEQQRMVEEAARQREIREAEAAKERDIRWAEEVKKMEIKEAEAARPREAPAPAPAQEPLKATTTIYRPAKPDKKESCDNLELKVGMKDTNILLCFYPTAINRSVGSYGVHEQWVYRKGAFRSPRYSIYDIYLYFENGVLTSFQEQF